MLRENWDDRAGERTIAALRIGGWLLAALVLAASVRADTPPLLPPPPPTVEQLAEQMRRLERQNAQLADQNQTLSRQLDAMTERVRKLEPTDAKPATKVTAKDEQKAPSDGQSTPESKQKKDDDDTAKKKDDDTSDKEKETKSASRFLVGEYDNERGEYVLVRPRDAEKTPFELRADLFLQARYSYFAPNTNGWVDAAGAPQPVRTRSSIEMMRTFIRLSGFAIDPKLQYTSFVFGSTAIDDVVWLGWINYRFCDAFDLRVGNWLVPGTREWYESFRFTLGADRLMATTFFRPNVSPGVWAQGEPVKGLHYVAMVANSLNRFNQGVERRGATKAFGGTLWWEPTADYGVGPSDVEDHAAPSWRLGGSFAASQEVNQGFTGFGLGNPEDTILRLSDGTPLFRPGALGPGVELRRTDVFLYTVDASLKYRGLGVMGEYFFRQLGGFQAVGGTPRHASLFDHGGLLQAGCFVIPKHLEPFARTSFVSGPFGGGSEYGGGINWYPRGSRDWRLTAEVLYINHSPAQNLLTGYRAGETGTLFQLQWFVDF